MTDEKKKHVSKVPIHSHENENEPPSSAQENPEVEAIETVSQEMISLPLEELEDLKSELEKAQKQSKEYFEGWQRERADFMNYKKRIERDQTQLHQVITANIIKKFLAVLDDMELAVKNRPEDATDQNWWSGVELITRKLQGILEVEGIARIPAEDENFDPNRHEAISHEENANFQSGQIIEVVKQGYSMGDKIIRPALVRVAR
jgi:molecular chaperone GrpE